MTEVFPLIALDPNSRNHETGRRNTRSESVDSERQRTSDDSASEALDAAGRDHGLDRGIEIVETTVTTQTAATTIGPNTEREPGNTASKMIITMISSGTTLRGRDRKLSWQGKTNLKSFLMKIF